MPRTPILEFPDAQSSHAGYVLDANQHEPGDQDDRHAEWLSEFEAALSRWAFNPVSFVMEVLNAQPDPWQCDVLDAILEYDNVAIRACHGVGKSTLLAWTILWFTFTRPFSKVPSTAPTFNKQVRDVLWAEVHKWYRIAMQVSPWLAGFFELTQTRMQHVQHPNEWFAVGIASAQAVNAEGYHSPHILAVFDEAKAIPDATWQAMQGMRTTQEAKLVAASTPGGPRGEFYKVFTEYNQRTWHSLFVIRPEALRAEIGEPEAPPYSTSGTYYSSRTRAEWVEMTRLEWGADSAQFISRVRGDFPTVDSDILIPYPWLLAAKDLPDGIAGPRWVSCDVARYGRDRTVFLVGEGGTFLYGETVARVPEETSSQELRTVGIGPDAKRPFYRGINVTADICQRLRKQFDCAGIVIDDTGLNGAADMLRERGENVVPISFGASPTDKSKTPEQRKARERRHLLDSAFTNIKAQMGWALRDGFEMRTIGLARLPEHIRKPLIQQTSLIKTEVDIHGRIRIVDPDDQDDIPGLVEEGNKSPDHFHAAMLLWWVTGGRRLAKPLSGTPGQRGIPPHVTMLGQPQNQAVAGQGQHVTASQQATTGAGGQGGWVRSRYR